MTVNYQKIKVFNRLYKKYFWLSNKGNDLYEWVQSPDLAFNFNSKEDAENFLMNNKLPNGIVYAACDTPEIMTVGVG